MHLSDLWDNSKWFNICVNMLNMFCLNKGWTFSELGDLLFSCSVMSNFLQLHELQHAKLPCPSLSPTVSSNSCPLSPWCYPTISASGSPFSSCLQSFPASWSFLTIRLLAPNGQSIGTSASASVLPMNIQGWFPLGLTCLISLHSKGLFRVFSSTTVWKNLFFITQPSLWSNSHPHMTTGKTVAFDVTEFDDTQSSINPEKGFRKRKQKNLKTHYISGTRVRNKIDFLSLTMWARRKWNNIF